MAVEVRTSDPSLPALVKGIVGDVGELIKQEFKFARTELKSDLRKTGRASLSLAIGVAVALLSLPFLALMLVHLLHWLSTPAPHADPAAIPLWGCFGIVGGLSLAIGIGLILIGRAKFMAFNPLPDETAQNIKENLEWITNSK